MLRESSSARVSDISLSVTRVIVVRSPLKNIRRSLSASAEGRSLTVKGGLLISIFYGRKSQMPEKEPEKPIHRRRMRKYHERCVRKSSWFTAAKEIDCHFFRKKWRKNRRCGKIPRCIFRQPPSSILPPKGKEALFHKERCSPPRRGRG